MTPKSFRTMFAVLHNLDLAQLVDAGVIDGINPVQWTRFNSDLTTFVLKLPEDRLAKLLELVKAEGFQP